MHRYLTRFAWLAVLVIGGCNQQIAVLGTPVGPSPTAAPIPVPAQPEIASMRISPGGVDGGDGSTGVVTLAGAAQLFPVTVSIASNDEVATVTPTAIVPAGSNIGHFGVTTRRLPEDRTVVISASTPGRTITTNFEVWAINAPVYFKYYSDEDDFVGGGLRGVERCESEFDGQVPELRDAQPDVGRKVVENSEQDVRRFLDASEAPLVLHGDGVKKDGLADVVYEAHEEQAVVRASGDGLAELFGEPGGGDGVSGYPDGMPSGVGILGLEGSCKHLHSLEEELLDPLRLLVHPALEVFLVVAVLQDQRPLFQRPRDPGL